MQDRKELRRLTANIALSVASAMLLVAVILAGLILWSARQADLIAIQRQERLVTTVLKQSIVQISHDQEASTVWDDAVIHLKVPRPDADWLDANLGVWFHTYYGHDATFIVDKNNQPIYAMWSGRRTPARLYYSKAAAVLSPMIAELRAKMRRPQTNVDATVLTPGVADLAIVNGHPSIVSVKPIVPESEKIIQTPGSEFVHASIRHLDGSFVKKLAEQYGFDGARFSQQRRYGTNEAAIPVVSHAGKTIGWILWRPFRPGSAVVRQVGIALAMSLLAMTAIVILLIRRIRRSTIELHASRAHAQHLAFHDNLTGLANRALFADRLDHELAGVRRAAHRTALLYLDLDRFKNVNDTLGHPSGDELIRQVAQRLKAMLRETDTVARLGGDEFAIIQTGVTSPADTEILCLRIVEEMNRPFDLGGTNVNVSVSIGVAMAPHDGSHRVELSRKADIALYSAKVEGRGRFMFFAPQMDESVRTRQQIETDLRNALAAGDQFEIHYQPLYSARTGRMTGAEALVRWLHPDRGLMSPVNFIPIAEETGLIEPLGKWVLEQACAAARKWEIDTISVNVSARQLRNSNFATTVLSILDRTGLDPHKLELEITETCLMENASECAIIFAALRSRGIRIALDDFGTGYSSFGQLRQLRVDRVKIDRSFVSGIDQSAGGSAIIRAIVDMARASGIEVTAEGVETAEQSGFLTRIGCQTLQGFLMSRPVRSEELERMLHLEQRVTM